MTLIAERVPASQIQSRQAEKEIAESSLRKLLPFANGKARSKNQSQINGRRYGFEEVNSAFRSAMFHVMEVSIPPSLTENLQLNKLEWVFVEGASPIPLTTLLAGYPKDTSFSDVNSAMATLEIARMKLANKNEPVPFLLRTAGVAKNAIIAVTYGLLPEASHLTELNVSIPAKECHPEMSRDFPTVSLPTDFDKPYTTAALITQQMCKDISGSAQHRALSFRLTGEKSDFHLQETTRGLMFSLGYYARNEERFVIVGLQPEAAERRGLTPWEVSIPTSLQKL